MKRLLTFSIILPLFSCGQHQQLISTTESTNQTNYETSTYSKVGEIPLPAGFERIKVSQNSFEEFVRHLPLKKDKTIYLYNGQPKKNQDEQFAVLDISVGNKDLQQCADAVMRIRAEFFYANKQFDQIRFTDNAGKAYTIRQNASRNEFDEYLENVFVHCGTLSLEKQLQKRVSFADAHIGDVFIQGGSPGHAMMIADMAANANGDKIFLLLQGFMPAQSIHIVKNLEQPSISPWYQLKNDSMIATPDWDFSPSQLRHW
jgi:hypothetical protein